jgi:carbon monoxide dehydrogenase subunit G
VILEHRCTIPAPVERLWEFMLDVPAVSRCLPGVEAFTAAGADEYHGAVKVKVGPVALRLEGRLVVRERDRAAWTARMAAEGRDPRILGGVTAALGMRLVALGPETTELHLRTDAAVLGKLGEFGQPIIRRSADRMVQQFADNIVRELAARQAATGAGR